MDNNMNPFAPQPSARPQGNSTNNNDTNTGASSNNPAASAAPALDPQLPPAMDSQSKQPQTTASLSDASAPMLNNTGVALGSPILGPTHFDSLKSPNFSAQPNAASPATNQSQAFGSALPQGAAQTNDAEKAKTFKVLAVLFGALAFIGIIVGIFSLVINADTSDKLAKTQANLKAAAAIIEKVQSDTGKTITSVNDVPEYTPVSGHIYIPEWGIKFKIPEDLEAVSYTLDEKYRPQICFTGYKTGIQYFPGFADIDQHPQGLGCATRVATYEGDTDKDTGASFGQKIYTYGDYNYFYTAPSGHYSQDAAEQGLEDTAAQIIKNMIFNSISHYE